MLSGSITLVLVGSRMRKLAFFTVSLLAILLWVLHGAHSGTSAAQDQVRIFFNPAEASLPPDTTFQLMLDAQSHQVVFARIELGFNPSLINLTDEITTTDKLRNVIVKTSKDVANSTGNIVIVLALQPGDSPPAGLFEFAQLRFGVVTTATNQITSLSVIDEGIQIVDSEANELPFTSQPATIILNPTIYLPALFKDYIPILNH